MLPAAPFGPGAACNHSGAEVTAADMTVHLVQLAGIRDEGVQAYACSVALGLVESLIGMRRAFRWLRRVPVAASTSCAIILRAAPAEALLRWQSPCRDETGVVITSRLSTSSAPAGYPFLREVIAVAVRWYLRCGLSDRDVEELLAERASSWIT